LQSDIGIGYGEDLVHVRQVLGDAVRSVSEVLSDQPVQVLFIKFDKSSMMVRIRWWIDTYSDKRIMQDKVNSALQDAIAAAGINSPYPTQALEVRLLSDEAGEVDDSSNEN